MISQIAGIYLVLCFCLRIPQTGLRAKTKLCANLLSANLLSSSDLLKLTNEIILEKLEKAGRFSDSQFSLRADLLLDICNK